MKMPIRVIYTNWKGETREREIIPFSVRFGSSEYHPDPQYLLLAEDVETGEQKEFSLSTCNFIVK